jgi:hypothetical protein
VIRKNAPADAILQGQRLGVEQQTEPASTEPQVGEKLRLVQRQELLDGLQFENHRMIDDDVCPTAAVDKGAAIVQRQIDLPRPGDRVPIESMAHAAFVGAFQQPRSEPAVHTHRQAEDLASWVAGVGCVHALPRFRWPGGSVLCLGLRSVDWRHSKAGEQVGHKAPQGARKVPQGGFLSARRAWPKSLGSTVREVRFSFLFVELCARLACHACFARLPSLACLP